MDRSTGMMVIACSDDGSVKRETRMIPQPTKGEILLKLTICGLCGTDFFKLNNATESAGTVLGHEIVGTVEKSVSSRFRQGDRIVVPHHVSCGECALCQRGSTTQCPEFKKNLFSPGGFSEFVLIREPAVRLAAYRIPDDVSDTAASFLEPAACVLRGINKAELPDDGCSVVIGGGTMGLLHLHVLRAVRPNSKVVIIDPIAERQAFALENGAIAALPPGHDALKKTINELTGELGADAIFDTVGGAGPLNLGFSAIRPGGSVVLFAHGGPGEVADFELNPFFKTEARLLATYSGGLEEQREISELIFNHILDATPLISHRMPLQEIDEAIQLCNQHKAYKILLVAQ